MSDKKIERVKAAIKGHPDFPKPVLRQPDVFRDLMEVMVDHVKSKAPGVQIIVGLESRGFLLGPLIAQELKCGFVPIRKKGKLPGETIEISYSLEYGQDTFEIQKEAVMPGQSVVIVDDLLATGGTMSAASKLVEKMGANLLDCLVVIELCDLKGRDKITAPCSSLIQY